MIHRLAALALQLLIALDQLLQVAIVGAFFVAGAAADCPRPDDTISAYVGRAEIRGRRWAQVIAAAIDWLFVLIGSQPGHCRRIAMGGKG